jgi:hypothetical protein
MRRREFIVGLGGVAVAWPLVVRAEQSALPVIGYFGTQAADDASVATDARGWRPARGGRALVGANGLSRNGRIHLHDAGRADDAGDRNDVRGLPPAHRAAAQAVGVSAGDLSVSAITRPLCCSCVSVAERLQ